MDAWMHGCMDAWMHGCMDAWMHGCMDAWMHGCMDAWMHLAAKGKNQIPNISSCLLILRFLRVVVSG
jgi:hypothetical protein